MHRSTACATPERSSQCGDRRVAANIHITLSSATSSSAITNSSRPIASSTSTTSGQRRPPLLPKDTDGRNRIRTDARGLLAGGLADPAECLVEGEPVELGQDAQFIGPGAGHARLVPEHGAEHDQAIVGGILELVGG